MPGVFISYRRDDTAAYAGRLFDILSAEFGRENTFMDLDTIKGGDDFSVVIERKLDVSDALLAVIGPRWLTVVEPNGVRRLDNPNDFVRVEIAKALERGIRVIPVLVGGAGLPSSADLPANLQALGQRQATEVRDSHFHEDVKDLTDVLHRTLHGTGFFPQSVNRPWFIPVLLVVVAVLAGGFGLLIVRSHRAAQTSPGTLASEPAKQAAATPPPAQTSGDAPANHMNPVANVAGEWRATVKYDWGDTYNELFVFEVDGQELSGTAGFLGTRKENGRAIWDGKIVGNKISFMTKTLVSLGSEDKTSEDKHYYKGTVNGDTIAFTMVTDSTVESHSPIHFTANRVRNK